MKKQVCVISINHVFVLFCLKAETYDFSEMINEQSFHMFTYSGIKFKALTEICYITLIEVLSDDGKWFASLNTCTLENCQKDSSQCEYRLLTK